LHQLLTESGKHGYVLNSETVAEPWAKKFLTDPDQFILDKKPDFFIMSPTGDSGISVTTSEYFTCKVSFFAGVLSTNSQKQAMFRLRDNTIPHYVFCPEVSTIRDGGTPQNYSPKAILEAYNSRITQSALLASNAAENPEKAIEIIMQALTRCDLDWWGFSTELLAIENFEKNNYRKCLIYTLEQSGHNVEVAEWETVTKTSEAEKAAKQAVQIQHAQEVFKAEPFSSVLEAEKSVKKAKGSPNKDTQRRIEKTRFLERLPGIENSEVWSPEFIYNAHIKNRDFIRQQERYWLLKNYEISQKRHESIWNHASLSEDFFNRQVSRMGHDVIWGLRELNLINFTESGEQYHKDSPEVINLVETLRSRKDIQTALHISQVEPETIEGKERLRILNALLTHIGYKTKFTRKLNTKTDRGAIRTRLYAIVPNAEKDTPKLDPQNLGTIESQKFRDTPPQSINKPGGYVPDLKPIASNDYSQFGLLEAREAILEAIEYKFTRWIKSDKSKISWEVDNKDVCDPTTCSPSEFRDTPPQSINKPGGCVPDLKPIASNDYSQNNADLANVTKSLSLSQPTKNWEGSSLRLKQGLEIANSWFKGLYESLSLSLGNFQLTADCEPQYQGEDRGWWIWANSPIGCKSIPCQWLEPITTVQ
jgi:hypothetical protein